MQVATNTEEPERGEPGYGKGRCLVEADIVIEGCDMTGRYGDPLRPSRLLRPGHDPGLRVWTRSVSCRGNDCSGHVLARLPTLVAGGEKPELTPVDRNGCYLHHGLVGGRLGLSHLDQVNSHRTIAAVDQCLHREREDISERVAVTAIAISSR